MQLRSNWFSCKWFSKDLLSQRSITRVESWITVTNANQTSFHFARLMSIHFGRVICKTTFKKPQLCSNCLENGNRLNENGCDWSLGPALSLCHALFPVFLKRPRFATNHFEFSWNSLLLICWRKIKIEIRSKSPSDIPCSRRRHDLSFLFGKRASKHSSLFAIKIRKRRNVETNVCLLSQIELTPWHSVTFAEFSNKSLDQTFIVEKYFIAGFLGSFLSNNLKTNQLEVNTDSQSRAIARLKEPRELFALPKDKDHECPQQTARWPTECQVIFHFEIFRRAPPSPWRMPERKLRNYVDSVCCQAHA